MEDDKIIPIEEITKSFEELKNENKDEVVTTNIKENGLLRGTIDKDYEKKLGELRNSSEYQERVDELVKAGADTLLQHDRLSILSEKQKNELAEYELDCEKQQLAYRKKKEKKLIKEQAKANIQKQKIEVLQTRYGYLYKLDENGKPKDFVASKFVNKYKELCNWYATTSDGFKKIVKGTLKIMFWCAIIFCAYKGFKWLAKSELLNKIN